MQLTEPVSPLTRWSLDPTVVHLNHGSYGGCPRAVTLTAAAWRTRLEAAPMRFLVLEWQTELDRARAALAEFLHAPAERLVFVPSATTGAAIALHSAPLAAGDEILTIDHAYRALRNQLARKAAAVGATVRIVPVPVPFDPGALVESIERAITPQTKLALIDHITSPTALVLPLEALLDRFAARGIAVIVDGAHAPGQIAVDVGALLSRGATWYAGNNHKWLCAPKGSGFLAIADGAPAVPVVTSHGASPEYGPPNRLYAELDWSGTYDPSAHLAVPSALATLAVEGGGWPMLYARNHALVVELARRFCDALGGAPLAGEAALGTMAAIPIVLPPNTVPFALQTQLLRDGWEVPIVDVPRMPLVRLSAHLYNHAGEADALAEKLRSLGVTGRTS